MLDFRLDSEGSGVFKLRQAERVTDSFVQGHPQTVRLGEENFDDARIELPARKPANFIAGCGNRQRFTVWAIGDHRVECICHREYSRAHRNLLATQTARVTRPVKTLLVRE